MISELLKTRRAILKRVAVLFLTAALSFPLFAETKKKTGETYKDLISKAHNLVLQKDRQQAMLVLSSALRSEKAGSKPYNEIKKALSEVSQVFISDKAQQLYELSLSLKRTDLPQANQRLNEALRIESDNFTLLNESVRQSLMRNECSAADEVVSKSLKLNPADEELILLQAQVQLCLNDLAGFQKIRDSANTSLFPTAWANLDIEKNIKEKNFGHAKEVLSSLKKQEKNYPELAYWEWKIDSELKSSNMDAAQKYMMDCRNLTVHTARKFNSDPWLCRRTAETETFLKNQNANQ